MGPLIGGALGGGAYQVLIHPFLPARNRARLAEFSDRVARTS
jgi:glycerol uptake facilitator protein